VLGIASGVLRVWGGAGKAAVTESASSTRASGSSSMRAELRTQELRSPDVSEARLATSTRYVHGDTSASRIRWQNAADLGCAAGSSHVLIFRSGAVSRPLSTSTFIISTGMPEATDGTRTQA